MRLMNAPAAPGWASRFPSLVNRLVQRCTVSSPYLRVTIQDFNLQAPSTSFRSFSKLFPYFSNFLTYDLRQPARPVHSSHRWTEVQYLFLVGNAGVVPPQSRCRIGSDSMLVLGAGLQLEKQFGSVYTLDWYPFPPRLSWLRTSNVWVPTSTLYPNSPSRALTSKLTVLLANRNQPS
jgi:hypothetical protein